MKITPWQDQIISGSLLGSGYISCTKPNYLGMSETRNHDWVHYKGEELATIQAKTSFSQCGNVVKWRSVSGDIWDDYYDRFYFGGQKRVSMEVLDTLRDIALAVWFGDKGFWYSNRRIGLRTTAFGENNEVLLVYFNEVGLECDLKMDSHGAKRIVFTRDGTISFLGTIAHRLPDFMHARFSQLKND
jgi:hypothetical protein